MISHHSSNDKYTSWNGGAFVIDPSFMNPTNMNHTHSTYRLCFYDFVSGSRFEISRKIQTLQPALRQLLPPFWHEIIKILLNFPKYVRPFNDGWRGNDLQWCNRLKIESDNLKIHRNPRMEGPTHQWIYRSEVKREIFWLDSIKVFKLYSP